jgi:hypothetical protein
VIRHLPMNTPAEDIAEGLGDLGFDVVNVRQLSTTRRSLEGSTALLPLFLESPHQVLQLPVWPRLGKLQAASSLLVVWRRSLTQRLSGQGQ